MSFCLTLFAISFHGGNSETTFKLELKLGWIVNFRFCTTLSHWLFLSYFWLNSIQFWFWDFLRVSVTEKFQGNFNAVFASYFHHFAKGCGRAYFSSFKHFFREQKIDLEMHFSPQSSRNKYCFVANSANNVFDLLRCPINYGKKSIEKWLYKMGVEVQKN